MQTNRPVLAVGDLSAPATNAAWRAALVARDLGVTLRLLHVPAGIGAVPAAQRALMQLADAIRDRIGIDVEIQVTAGDMLRVTADAARDAALVVLAAGRRRPLRDWLSGTPAERLLRRCGIPVLVVRRTATGGYRRVLVPVDLGADAAAVIAAAARVSRDPRMEVLHALAARDAVTMRAADVPEPVLRDLREREAQRTRAALASLIAWAGADRQGAVPTVAFGPAAGVVLARAQAVRSELLVIGKRRRSLLAEFLLGGVTPQVLAATRADVLLLPTPGRASDFRDQLDLDAGARGNLRHAEGTARVRPLGAEHLAQQFARAVDHQVVLGEAAG